MFQSGSACPLCKGAGGEVLHQAQAWRLVLADEPEWPGLLRLIWTEHVMELSDLSELQAIELLRVIRLVERVLRDTLSPDKVNVASLGNQVPHLHVHIVPRWRDDLTFPASIWTRPEPALQTNLRSRTEAADARRRSTVAQIPALRQALIESLRHSY